MNEIRQRELANRFRTIESKLELLNLINDVIDVLFNSSFSKGPKTEKKIRHFTLAQLNYYALASKKRKQYTSFIIAKKNGNDRHIKAPVKGLKVLQKCINYLIQVSFEPTAAATGFVPGRSILDNAKKHVGKSYVYNADLENFFPSINFRRVKTVLMLDPIGINDQLVFLVGNICCKDGMLPQGAPSSPVLSNLICRRLDKKLLRLARKYKSTYSRYADDITFSSNEYCFDSKFEVELHAIICEEKFIVNSEKTRLQKRGYKQEVTGLIVNEKVNLRKEYVQEIRSWLHVWKKFGLEAVEKSFNKRYLAHGKGVNFTNVIVGKLNYMKMIRGAEDLLYLKYFNQFHRLMKGESENRKIDLYVLMDNWEKEGIDSAMRYFNLQKKLVI